MKKGLIRDLVGAVAAIICLNIGVTTVLDKHIHPQMAYKEAIKRIPQIFFYNFTR